MQVTRGRLALVDGTLWPCWSWKPARELWAGKYGTTGHGGLVISDEYGNIILPGSTSTCTGQLDPRSAAPHFP
jgi:hypothetical protein